MAMPNRKTKQRLKALHQAKVQEKQAAARKAELEAMRAKLIAGAQASAETGEPSVLEQLPPISVRQRKALKNRIRL
jgi:hypothetical protein